MRTLFGLALALAVVSFTPPKEPPGPTVERTACAHVTDHATICASTTVDELSYAELHAALQPIAAELRATVAPASPAHDATPKDDPLAKRRAIELRPPEVVPVRYVLGSPVTSRKGLRLNRDPLVLRI